MATTDEACIVVFPSIFAKKRVPQLVANIKSILKIREQRFSSVTREGDIILVRANDPVFASSAIGLLFGVSKVAIAKQVTNEYRQLVSKIASIGGNLLLKNERFLVRVDGTTKGYTTKDAEIAATSQIISRKEHGAIPGTEEKFDKEIYTYVTQKNAYVCIFSDGGSWGTPFDRRNDMKKEQTAVCAIYDELSALSCFECMRLGYDVRIIVFYKKRADLLNLARLLNRLIPRMLSEEIEIEFVHMTKEKIKRKETKVNLPASSYLTYIDSITEFVLEYCSDTNSRISLALPHGMFPADVVDVYQWRVFERGMTPLVPLTGSGMNIYEIARELSLGEAGIKRLERQVLIAATTTTKATARDTATTTSTTTITKATARDTATTTTATTTKTAEPKKITIKIGSNNLHDILDSLYPPSAPLAEKTQK